MKIAEGKATGVWLAGGLALIGYGALAARAEDPDALRWLALAQVLGWLALGGTAWRGRESRAARRAVIVCAAAFRLTGLGVSPAWEDDYHRYLWDGYVTITNGDPYASAPVEAFGREDALPVAVATALDGINHPDLPTIYGPVPQVAFALAAWVQAGSFGWLKLLLVAVELAGWWMLRRQLAWRGWVLVCWCPLGVTEIAFTGHPEALGVAATAAAIAAWQRARGKAAGIWVALATAVKPFGAALAPWVGWRFGWRAAMAGGAVWVACYLPFWLQGSVGEWPALRIMSQSFEYNSTGFAVLGWLLPQPAARVVALLILIGVAGWLGRRWLRGPVDVLPPVAPLLGVALLMSPVVNPWYALWLLPWLGVRPSGWGIGVLLAVPLAYTHGWGEAMGAGVDYTHPWWTRPLELVVVGTAAAVAVVGKKLKR